MKPQIELNILPATEEDFPAIGRFLQNNFFPEEPLNSSLKRCPEPESIPFLQTLKYGLSFKAVNMLDNSEDNILGVAVNKEESINKKPYNDPNPTPESLKIRKILMELDDKSKIWEAVNNENHFNIICLSVNKNYRGLGLGRKLLEESLRLAKSLNYKYASIECSSFYSGKIAVDIGFKVLAEIPYDEYLNEDGEPLFKVTPPHKALKKLMITL